MLVPPFNNIGCRPLKHPSRRSSFKQNHCQAQHVNKALKLDEKFCKAPVLAAGLAQYWAG
jgi:hypothetical protein